MRTLKTNIFEIIRLPIFAYYRSAASHPAKTFKSQQK